MGYYSGSGETTGGSCAVEVFAKYYGWGTPHTIYQRRRSSAVRKSGVSLDTASSADGSSELQDHQFAAGTAAAYLAPACKGTIKSTTYSQINGSNLYELLETTEILAVKLDTGAWQT